MKIIAATDGTNQSKAVLDAVSRLQLPSGSEIIVATVVDMGLSTAVDLYSLELPNAAEAEAHAKEHAGRVLAEAIARLETTFSGKGVTIRPATLFGSPDSRIVELAESESADMVVVGSHGYNRWERLLLGSVSDSIVHHAPCSVLVVRD